MTELKTKSNEEIGVLLDHVVGNNRTKLTVPGVIGMFFERVLGFEARDICRKP